MPFCTALQYRTRILDLQLKQPIATGCKPCHNKTRMSDTTQSPVQDAEIVTEPPNPSSPPPAFDINAYNATLEIVRHRLTLLEKARAEMKTLNEMYNDIFTNDDGYNEADKVVKEALKKKKDVKAQLAKQAAAVETYGKIKDLKAQIKDNEEALSQELMEYYKTSGVTEIETEDGDVQEFKIVVKLKAKKRAEK